MLSSRFLAALLVFFATDEMLFCTGFYQRLIEPDSSVGIYCFRRGLALSKIKQGGHLVALVGDSRIQAAFSSRIFDQIANSTPFKAVNLGVPASSLRVWYFLLKQVDPDRNAFDLIVIPLASYADVDEEEDYPNRLYDLRFFVPFCSPADLSSVFQSFTDLNAKLIFIVDAISKLHALRLDIGDLLLHPLTRLNHLSRFEKFGEEGFYRYKGYTTTLSGMKLSNRGWLKGSSTIDDLALQKLNYRVSVPPPPQTGMRQRYNSVWLNQLVDDYAESKTKILLIKMPTEPVARSYQLPKCYASLNSIAKKKNVFILSEGYFDNFNTAQYFGDDVHLNSLAMPKFSSRLSEVILGLLAADNSIAQESKDLAAKERSGK
jgi:hypothetical protein